MWRNVPSKRDPTPASAEPSYESPTSRTEAEGDCVKRRFTGGIHEDPVQTRSILRVGRPSQTSFRSALQSAEQDPLRNPQTPHRRLTGRDWPEKGVSRQVVVGCRIHRSDLANYVEVEVRFGWACRSDCYFLASTAARYRSSDSTSAGSATVSAISWRKSSRYLLRSL